MKSKTIHEMYSVILGQLNDEAGLHSEKVALICEYIAPLLGLDERIAYKIGLLHDVGKIYIPSRILKKNHGLNELEREIIDLHSYYGYKLLKGMGEPPIIYMPALFHHGFWKTKLSNMTDEPLTDEIVKYIYLLHSADIYEAMSSKRVYHEPVQKDVILEALKDDVMCTEGIISVIREADMEKVVLPANGK